MTFLGTYLSGITGTEKAGVKTGIEAVAGVSDTILEAASGAGMVGAAAGGSVQDFIDSVSTVGLLPVSSGVFFNTSNGDLFTALSTPVDATLTVTAGSIAFNSPTAKTLDCSVKDSDGNTLKHCFDSYTVDATYTVTSFPAVSVDGVLTGGVNDVQGVFAGRLGASGAGATLCLAVLWNQSTPLVTDGSSVSIASPISVRSVYTRAGTTASHTVTYPGPDQRVLSLTQVFDATSYELPRLFNTMGAQFKQGNLTMTSLTVSALYPSANFAFVGDSLTQGRFASTYANGFARKVRDVYPNDTLICGAPSATTENWLDALTPVIDMAPRHAFVMLGVNDITTGRAQAAIEADYTALIGRLEAAGIVPIVISVAPCNHTGVPAFNAWLAAQPWTYIDIYTPMLGTGNAINPAYDSGDGLHWNDAGHTLVYNAVIDAIAVHNLDNPTNAWLVDADGAMSANSDQRLATQKATRTYVAAQRGSGSSALGYDLTVRGTVTQATSKATGVALNALVGDVTLNNAALAANTAVSFTMTNSAVAAATYDVRVNHISGGTAGAYAFTAFPSAGSVAITVRNLTAGSLGEAIVLRVTVGKS